MAKKEREAESEEDKAEGSGHVRNTGGEHPPGLG